MNHISTPPANAEPAHSDPAQLLRGKIAFIRASWHLDIVDQARVGFLDHLEEHGISDSDVEVIDVPGAYEIPLLAKRLAKSGNYDIIVAAGLVVDGGIYAHQFVAEAVISGMMQVQLETDVPILSVVLTPQDYLENNKQHHKFFFDHFITKGEEAAKACVMVLKQNAVAIA